MYQPADRKTTVAALLILVLLGTLFVLPGCGSNGAATGKSSASGATAVARPDSGARFSFIVCGDPQNNYDVFDRVLEAAKGVNFLLIAGDLTGSGTATEFQNFRATMASSGVKYYSVPGNHDVATMPVDQGYAAYIGPPHQSFDFANSHFLLIDNSTPSQGFYPAERAWAREDLKAASARGFEHVFAVAHVPPGYPYSAQADPKQIAGIDANAKLAPLLHAGGAQELFCGHVHTYMQDKEDGLLVTITGGAGAPLMGADSYHNYVLVQVDGRTVQQKVVRI